MRDQLQPGVGKTWCTARTDDVVHMADGGGGEDIEKEKKMIVHRPNSEHRDIQTAILPESMKYRKANCVEHRVGGVEVVEKHDEEAVVGQLVELCGLGLVVLQEYMGNGH